MGQIFVKASRRAKAHVRRSSSAILAVRANPSKANKNALELKIARGLKLRGHGKYGSVKVTKRHASYSRLTRRYGIY